MTDTTAPALTAEELDDIRQRAEKASPGPWETDAVLDSELEYGSGDNGGVGFDCFVVVDPAGRRVVDTLNSGLAEVLESGPDEDGFVDAWDEVGRRNADFIAHARTDIPRLLSHISALTAERDAATARATAAEQERDAAREALKPFASEAASWADEAPDSMVIYASEGRDFKPAKTKLTLGDLRRAAALTSQDKGGEVSNG